MIALIPLGVMVVGALLGFVGVLVASLGRPSRPQRDTVLVSIETSGVAADGAQLKIYRPTSGEVAHYPVGEQEISQAATAASSAAERAASGSMHVAPALVEKAEPTRIEVTA